MKRFYLKITACLISLLLAAAFVCSAAEETYLYREDFESGSMDGWISYEEKSEIVETEEGHAYHVCSYDYNSKTTDFADYCFTLRMKIDYKEGTAAPAFYLRRGADGNRYEAYIDAAGGKMVVDRVVNEEKTNIGVMVADFAADNLRWVSVKFILSGKNLWIYYSDMEQPKAKLRDENALTVGGIGFGFGNADFFVDDLEISELAEPLPEPYEISPEENKDYKDNKFCEEIDRLMAFGIVNAYDDGKFRPDNSVSRAEFAALVVRTRNLQPDSQQNTLFNDVPPDNWAAPFAATVYAMGCMNGTGNGSFSPNEPITLEQAAKVLSHLLGAEALCERRGGYPSGYLAYASQNGVLKGVRKNNGEALTRAEVAKLIANTLELDLLQQTTFGNKEEYTTEKGVTLLSEYREIYRFRGRITANYFAGILADEQLCKDEILLDGLKMKIGKTGASALLGYYVTAYARCSEENELPELVWIAKNEEKSNSLKVAAENILPATNTEELVYQEENSGKVMREPLSKNTNLILNGGSGSFTEKNLKPQNGGLTLFDTDDDGVYETVLSESYETLVVGNISAQQRKIYDKYLTSKVLDLSDGKMEVFIYRGYEAISFEQIAPLSVLSVAQTEAGAMHAKTVVRVSEKKIQGKISEYETGAEHDFIKIKDKDYLLNSYFVENMECERTETVRAGTTATLLLDSFGKVAAAELSQVSDFMLLNAVMWQKGADSRWTAELFTSDGKWLDAGIAADLRYNGKKIKLSENNLPADLQTRQIAKVKFNSKGLVSAVDTAAGADVLVKKRVYDSWPMEYISQTKSFDTDSYVDEQTLVFAVPYYADKKEEYVASDYTYFKNGSTYRLWSYNEDQFEVADIILVFEKENAGGNGKYSRPFFFAKETKALNGKGEEIKKITGYCGGEEVSYVVAEGAEPELSCGDSLVLSKNGKGEVVSCEYLYRISDGETGSDNSDFGMSGDRITVAGKVLAYDTAAGRVLLDVGNGAKREKAFLIGGAQQVYYCDRTRKKINKTVVSEICVGDFVVMDFSWNVLRDIMVYRN